MSVPIIQAWHVTLGDLVISVRMVWKEGRAKQAADAEMLRQMQPDLQGLMVQRFPDETSISISNDNAAQEIHMTGMVFAEIWNHLFRLYKDGVIGPINTYR